MNVNAVRAIADMPNQCQQAVKINGFRQHLDGVEPRTRPLTGPRRQNHDRNAAQAGIPPFAREELTAVHYRHLIIEQNHIRGIDVGKYLERVPAVACRVHDKPVLGEELPQQRPNVGVVID